MNLGGFWREHFASLLKKTLRPNNNVINVRQDHPRIRAFSYAWSLPVTWQRWRSHHSIRRNRKRHAARRARKHHGSRLWSNGSYCRSKFHITGIEIFDLFAPVTNTDHDLHPMTFIYELDPQSVEIHCMCKYELPTSRLSKVIVWQTYIQTDRHTDTTKTITHAASRVATNIFFHFSICFPCRLSVCCQHCLPLINHRY